ncbi:MAG: hypothetical protein ACXWPM_00060 [Bdellovibrionota bacterium]
MTFLKRTGNSYSEYPDVPIASALSYSTDVRQFSGAFDFQMSLAHGETFAPRSHDAVEFSVQVNGKKQQIGVGFIEDFVDDSDERESDFKSNGRDLIGQLVSLPYITHVTYKPMTILEFTRFSLKNTYLLDYLNFRGRSNAILDKGAYQNALLVVTTNSVKRGASIQSYEELAQNLIYQNPEGRIEIYGRQPSTKPIGKLIRAPGQSNVDKIRRSNSFSKVVTSCTVEWTAGQEHVDRNALRSKEVKNTDSRVAHVYQPETRVFSAGDLQGLAGKQDASTRVNSLAKSIIRKSMSSVGAVIVNTSEPFFTDKSTGKQIVFRTMQDWHVQDPLKGIDKTLRIAGISYTQDYSQLNVQLAFVEPDTLV